MNILLIAGRLPSHPWSNGAFIARIARGLVSRNHRIHLLCQALDDPQLFEGLNEAEAFEPYINDSSPFPIDFPLWTRAHIRRGQHDAILSFSRRVSGDVWMPLEPDAAAWIAHTLATSTRFSAAVELARRAGVFLDAIDQTINPLPRGPTIKRVICIGGPSTEAAGVFARGSLTTRIVRAPLSSDLPILSPDEQHTLRRQTREALSLSDNRLVLLASITDGQAPPLDGLLAALASLNPPASSRAGPALIILTREPYRAHNHAVRAGCDRHVRVIGTTHSIAAVLAACDAAATCIPLPIDAFRAGSTSRFAADAIRSGRPVLALTGSSGIAALGLSTPEIPVPGTVVASPSAADWTRALKQAADEPWLTRASRAAARLAPMLDPDRLLDCLEGTLREASTAAAATSE